MKNLFYHKEKMIFCFIIVIVFGALVFESVLLNNKKVKIVKDNAITNEKKQATPIVVPKEKKFQITFENFELNNHLKKYMDKLTSIDIDYIENNIIYGSVLDTINDPFLYTTICLFQYNTKTKKYKEYEYNKGRIFDYYVDEKDIYFISEKLEADDYYHWKLNKSTLSFETIEELESGNIKYDVNSPRLLKDNVNDELYLLTVKNNGEIQTSDLCKVDGNKIEKKESFFGNHETKKGSFINAMLYVTIQKDKIYYIRIDDYEKNSLIEYDTKTNQNNILKEDFIEDDYYQSFFITELGIFMNSKYDDSNDFYKIRNYFKKKNSEKFLELENYNKELYFGRKFNEDTISFINLNQWYFLDINDLKIYAGPKYEEQYPNHYVWGDNQILFQNFNQNWYIGTFSEKN